MSSRGHDAPGLDRTCPRAGTTRPDWIARVLARARRARIGSHVSSRGHDAPGLEHVLPRAGTARPDGSHVSSRGHDAPGLEHVLPRAGTTRPDWIARVLARARRARIGTRAPTRGHRAPGLDRTCPRAGTTRPDWITCSHARAPRARIGSHVSSRGHHAPGLEHVLPRAGTARPDWIARVLARAPRARIGSHVSSRGHDAPGLDHVLPRAGTTRPELTLVLPRAGTACPELTSCSHAQAPRVPRLPARPHLDIARPPRLPSCLLLLPAHVLRVTCSAPELPAVPAPVHSSAPVETWRSLVPTHGYRAGITRAGERTASAPNVTRRLLRPLPHHGHGAGYAGSRMSSPSDPIHFACTNCGAHLTVDGSTQTPTCAYCNTEMLLPEAIWRRFHPPLLLGTAEPSCTHRREARHPRGRAGRRRRRHRRRRHRRGRGPRRHGRHDGHLGAAQPGRDARRGLQRPPRGVLERREGGAALRSERQDGGRATCKGPNACRATVGGKNLTCDTTLADLNDPCNIADDACSTDRKVELRCQAGHFAIIATCKGPDGCTLTPSKTGSGYTLSCDDHVADVGDPCFDTERTACSSDKKALFTCTAQRFVVHRACKKGCMVRKLVGTASTGAGLRVGGQLGRRALGATVYAASRTTEDSAPISLPTIALASPKSISGASGRTADCRPPRTRRSCSASS